VVKNAGYESYPVATCWPIRKMQPVWSSHVAEL
jgi:hypothetical protein